MGDTLRFLSIVLFVLGAASASAQNFGNIPPQTVIGNPSTSAKQPAQPMPATSLDIRQFAGADSTGATSSAAAMTSAIAYLVAAGGGTLRLAGAGAKYAMHGVVINGSAIKVACDRGVSIVNDSTNAPALTFGDGVTQYQNVSILDCTFIQKSGVTPVSGNIGLQVSKMSHTLVDNLVVTGLYRGVVINNSSVGTTLSSLWVVSNLGDGITLNSASDVRVLNSSSDGSSGNGFTIIDCAGLYFVASGTYGNHGNGFNMSRVAAGNTNFFFDNVGADTSGSDNWVITQLDTGSFTNVWGASQISTTVNPAATGFLLSSGNVKNLTFNSLQTLNNNGDGVHIVNASGGMPGEITFNAPTFGGQAGNGKGGAGYGLRIDNAATVVKVYGGQSSGNATGPVNYGPLTTGLDITWTDGIGNVSKGVPGWGVSNGYLNGTWGANGTYPKQGFGWVIGANLSNGSAEMNFINTWTSPDPGNSFLFAQQTGPSAATNIMSLGTVTTSIYSANFVLGGITSLAGNEILCYSTSTGKVTYAAAVAGCVPSAARFKDPLSWGLETDRIDLLRPAAWQYKDKKEWGERPYVGLYADDVEKMDPRCVSRDKDGHLENYEDRCVIAYLVATVQEQKKQIAALQGQSGARR